MSAERLVTHMKYYGISPWEIEVAYEYFNSRFRVTQEEIEPDDPDFVSMLSLDIPLEFNQAFFTWFEFKRWNKVKALFKEMKRRRGGGNALKIQVNFVGSPKIRFIVDTEDRHLYNNAVEKIDFVLELLPYHLDPEKLPNEVTEVIYRFDPKAARWRLNTAFVKKKKFVFKDNGWKMIT